MTDKVKASLLSTPGGSSTSLASERKSSSKNLLVVKNYILDALEKKAQGTDSSNYDYIVAQLSGGAETPSALRRWIRATAQCVSVVGEQFPALVNALLSFPWKQYPFEKELLNAYSECLLNFVSTKSSFIVPVLRTLIKQLVFLDDDGDDASTSYTSVMDKPAPDTLTEAVETTSEQRAIRSHVHSTLQALFENIPTASQVLHPILEANFPHRRESAQAQCQYTAELLKMSEYVPELREKILSTVIDRLVQIDVEIKLEDLPDDESYETDEDLQFDVEIPDVNMSQDDNQPQFSLDMDQVVKPTQHPEDRADIMAGKLDLLMEQLFDYLDTYRNEAKKGSEKSIQAFHSLLRVFDTSILATHRSKYVQFTLFYASSLSETYLDLFLGHLHQRLLDTNESPHARLSAAAYIGSFLARALFAPNYVVMNALKLLNQYLLDYVERAKKEGRSNPAINTFDLSKHIVFYGVTQAVMYTFCFRRVALLGDTMTQGFIRSEFDLIPVVESNLNPLRAVLPSVTREFIKTTEASVLPVARVARKINKANKRAARIGSGAFVSMGASAPSTSNTNGANGANAGATGESGVDNNHSGVDSFFPFDPYLLAHSSARISALYVEWIPDNAIEYEPRVNKRVRDRTYSASVSPLGFSVSPGNSPGKQGASSNGVGLQPRARRLSHRGAVKRQRRISHNSFQDKSPLLAGRPSDFDSESEDGSTTSSSEPSASSGLATRSGGSVDDSDSHLTILSTEVVDEGVGDGGQLRARFDSHHLATPRS